jgi:hypothetical protein
MTILTPRLSSVAEAAGLVGIKKNGLSLKVPRRHLRLPECPNVLARSKVDDDDQ